MIVLIGHPGARRVGEGIEPAGAVAVAALEAVRSGTDVQLVGKVGDDAEGDALVLALGAARIGHVAVLRDPARRTPVSHGREDDPDETDPLEDGRGDRPRLDAADVELGLRYLTDFRAVVLAEPLPEAVVRVAAEAASYAGAPLIGLQPAGAVSLDTLPAGSLLIEADEDDAGDGLGTLLGRVAAAVDRGETADEAFQREAGALGATAGG